MTDITIANLTSKTTSSDGTGAFDVLMKTVELHLDKQYQEGRITGPEYSTVYLGSIQSVMQNSLSFILQEQEASKKIELLERQIIKAQEETDMVRAQTAKAYADIAATEANTSRQNILNNKQVIKVQKETSLIELQTTELAANGTKDRLVKDEQITEIQEKVDLLESQDLEVLAATVRDNSFVAQKVLNLIGEDDLNSLKEDLVAAQTLGFKTDAKQKVLKQILDAWSISYSVSEVAASIPAAIDKVTIDYLQRDILADLDSNVTGPDPLAYPPVY